MPSRFDKDTIREYFEMCQRTGKKRVGNINSLTDHAHKTGNNDEEIREWLFPSQVAEMMTCPTCNGAGKVPQSKPELRVCFNCDGAEELVRFNPQTDKDEMWPCPVCQAKKFQEQQSERGLIRAPAIKFPAGKDVVSLRDAKLLTGTEGDDGQGANL